SRRRPTTANAALFHARCGSVSNGRKFPNISPARARAALSYRRARAAQDAQGAAAVGLIPRQLRGHPRTCQNCSDPPVSLPVHVPAVVFPEILDVVIPRRHIRAAGHLGIELLERNLTWPISVS